LNIFIDESGSFVNATTPESWNSIAAYISPESDRKRLREIVARLKRSVEVPTNVEVKLKNLSESQYFEFLGRIGQLDGALYAVATDAGLNQQTEKRSTRGFRQKGSLSTKTRCTTSWHVKDYRLYRSKWPLLHHNSIFNSTVKLT
jgi:hypothetical protein